MSRILEIEGKTIDEAIFAGLEQMGLSFDEVDIEYLQESNKGFLGIGRTSAKVRLTEREKTDDWGSEKAKPEPVKAQPKPRAEKSVQANRKRSEKRSDRREAFENAPIVKKEIVGEAVGEDEPAVAFLSGMLASMGIEAQIKAVRNQDGLYIDISGQSMGQIIGYRGETLDAMQYLTSLVENKGKDDYVRVTLDTENYRAKREQTLIRLGKRLADKALKSGRRVSLEPMNPYERRIIHSALQDVNGVTTVSEGEEPNRRVIILPER